MSNITKDINSLYNKDGYYEKYGISLLVSILIILIFFVGWSYFKIMTDIKPIKDDWFNQRCNPRVIPFAGLINKPDGMSAFEFTGQNFAGCTQSILKQISGYALMPINYSVSLVNDLMMGILKSIQAMRTMLSKIRNSTSDFTKDTMGRTLNIMIPFQQIVIALRDTIGKVQAILAGGLFTGMGVYMTIKSSLGAIYQTVVMFLIALAALIIILWLIPFSWVAAASLTSVFVVIVVLMSIFAIFLKKILNMSGGGKIPKKPRCFDGDTLIKLNNGNKIGIKDIKPGMLLDNNNKVTSTFKFTSMGVDMYKYNDVIVSGTHLLKHNDEFQQVGSQLSSVKIDYYNKEFIYCINTENKNIFINDIEFCDYDELTGEERVELFEKLNIDYSIKQNYKLEDKGWINQYLEGGFKGSVELNLEDGHTKSFKTLEVGDILCNGELVLGKIEINSEDIKYLKKLVINNKEIVSGPNVQIFNKDHGIARILDIDETEENSDKLLYNIITDNCRFNIENTTFLDYNSNIDLFLEKETKLLLTRLYI
jgi:hypothetical protein